MSWPQERRQSSQAWGRVLDTIRCAFIRSAAELSSKVRKYSAEQTGPIHSVTSEAANCERRLMDRTCSSSPGIDRLLSTTKRNYRLLDSSPQSSHPIELSCQLNGGPDCSARSHSGIATARHPWPPNYMINTKAGHKIGILWREGCLGKPGCAKQLRAEMQLNVPRPRPIRPRNQGCWVYTGQSAVFVPRSRMQNA